MIKNVFIYNKYLSEDPCEEIINISADKKIFKIKTIDDHTQSSIINKIVDKSLCVTILANCFLDSKTVQPIGKVRAQEYISNNCLLAEFIIREILCATRQRREAENICFENEIKNFIQNKYMFLKYCYCQRFALDPEKIKINRKVLIREQAFRSLNFQGLFKPDKRDHLLSSMTWLILLITGALGYDVENLEKQIIYGNQKFKKEKKNFHDNVEEINKTTDLFFKTLKTIYSKNS